MAGGNPFPLQGRSPFLSNGFSDRCLINAAPPGMVESNLRSSLRLSLILGRLPACCVFRRNRPPSPSMAVYRDRVIQVVIRYLNHCYKSRTRRSGFYSGRNTRRQIIHRFWTERHWSEFDGSEQTGCYEGQYHPAPWEVVKAQFFQPLGFQPGVQVSMCLYADKRWSGRRVILTSLLTVSPQESCDIHDNCDSHRVGDRYRPADDHLPPCAATAHGRTGVR
jgi:hypothetical protein